MIKLEEGEEYKIETLQDLLLAPVNMQEDIFGAILDIWNKRIEYFNKKGKDVTKINKFFLTVENTGKHTINSKFLVNGEKFEEWVGEKS